MKKIILKTFIGITAIVLIVSCTVIDKGVVISKSIEHSRNKKSVKYIGKVMVPSITPTEKQFVIVLRENTKNKSFLIDSLTYTQIQVNDSIIIKKNRIIRRW